MFIVGGLISEAITMQNDLKSCPLCGCEAYIEEIDLRTDTIHTKIVCRGCGLELNHTQEFMIHEVKDPMTGEIVKITRIALNESATDVWNRRVENDTV
jgi:hypothetical protein